MYSSEELHKIAEEFIMNGEYGLASLFRNKARQAEQREEYEKYADLWAIVRNS